MGIRLLRAVLAVNIQEKVALDCLIAAQFLSSIPARQSHRTPQ
ncbi:hypothetical protein XBO1_1800040 [Xenorhabdus bovienii str. oregonense]|uniref:Uncharacterized protein n=1 Tax=Xenorhabdus bovienii str. oregonense TaxID=1398202 RepID=A0A077P2J1_XENBV|nr:hypothetical protein XBO1_1800040 [Xenorhabdus bovienii str. oregonense]